MYTNTIGLLFLIAAVTKGQAHNVTSLSSEYPDSSVVRNDDFISEIKKQHVNILLGYDINMENFRKSYDERPNTIDILHDALIDYLIETEQRLNLLQALEDSSKACVKKYRSSIPTIAQTKLSVAGCINETNSQVNTILSAPLNTRNILQNYYLNDFERELRNCSISNDNWTLKYTLCLRRLASTSTNYTINNKKTFENQMDLAECSAKVNTKNALTCFYGIQVHTITSVAKTNTLIETCMSGQENCGQCSQGYTCSDVYYLNYYEVDFRNTTMLNPFYGRYNHTDCLMLDIRH